MPSTTIRVLTEPSFELSAFLPVCTEFLEHEFHSSELTSAPNLAYLCLGEQTANMGSAAQLRRQLESALAERIPAALSFRSPVSPELISCGLAEVDAVLGGGLPLGAITELTGTHSSGRTTLALAVLAGITSDVTRDKITCDVTRQGESCAYVDVSDALNPASAAALGVDLHRLLWVRAAEPCVPSTPLPSTPPQPIAYGAQRMRGENKLWTRLDHALRATDLLLNTGGFRALVLDMGDVPPEQARRVPLATWYRFRLQAEKSRTLFLLITRVACANSCAAVSLHCRQGAIEWQQAAERSPRLLAGLRYRVSVQRHRAVDPLRKKPAAAAEAAWSSTPIWSR